MELADKAQNEAIRLSIIYAVWPISVIYRFNCTMKNSSLAASYNQTFSIVLAFTCNLMLSVKQ